jgi:hypothetical protein
MMNVGAPAVPADDERRVRDLLYGTRRQARTSLDPDPVDVVAAEEPGVLMGDREPPAGPEPDRRTASGLGRLRRAREERRRRLAQELVLQQEISGPRAGAGKTAPAGGAGDSQPALAAAEERAAAAKRELKELRRRYRAEVEELARIGAESLGRAEAAERRLAATRELVRDLSESTALAEAGNRQLRIPHNHQLRILHNQLQRERRARSRLARQAVGHLEEIEHKAERLAERAERVARRRFEEPSEPPPLDAAGAGFEPGEVGPSGRTAPRRRSPAA